MKNISEEKLDQVQKKYPDIPRNILKKRLEGVFEEKVAQDLVNSFVEFFEALANDYDQEDPLEFICVMRVKGEEVTKILKTSRIGSNDFERAAKFIEEEID